MAPLFATGFSIVSGEEGLFRQSPNVQTVRGGRAGDAWDSFILLKRAYYVSFDNAAIARIANNLAAQVDLYNETSAQICAKGGTQRERKSHEGGALR